MTEVNASLNVTLEGASLLPARPPETYLGVATALLPGITILGRAPLASPIALALLSAHATECLLKGYLSRGGDDTRLMKPEIRHELDKLWRLAAAENLPVESSPPDWVQRLSGVHNSPYHLRYSTGVHGISLPPAVAMVEGVETLAQLVRQALEDFRRGAI